MTFNYIQPHGPKFQGAFSEKKERKRENLHIVSYNIKYAKKVDRAICELAESDILNKADLILLQEMDERGTDFIAQQLGFNYVYFPASMHRRNFRNFGNAVLSVFPVVDAQKILLPHEDPTSDQRRMATYAKVDVNGIQMGIISAHTQVFWFGHRRQREEQFSNISNFGEYEYSIIGGDFNSVLQKDIDFLDDVFLSNGFYRGTENVGYTHKLGPFKFALDHIFVKGMPVVQAGKVETVKASDHYPVWITTQMPTKLPN